MLQLDVVVETLVAVSLLLDAVAQATADEAYVADLQDLRFALLVLFALLHEDHAHQETDVDQLQEQPGDESKRFHEFAAIVGLAYVEPQLHKDVEEILGAARHVHAAISRLVLLDGEDSGDIEQGEQ